MSTIACLSPNGSTSVALDAPPLEILAGTATGVIRIAREAVGQPWRIVGRALEKKHIGSLVCGRAGRVFAGCHNKGGLHRSLDGGVTWHEIGREVVATGIFALALSEDQTGGTLLAGTEPVNLFRSDDFGDSWQELPAIKYMPGAEKWTFPPPPHVPHLKSILIDPSDRQSFYGCVEQGALLQTRDGGASWSEVTSMWRPTDPYYRDAHRVLAPSWNPSMLLFSTGIGLYRSIDSGLTWTHDDELSRRINYPDGLVATPDPDRRIFVSGPRDNPLTWLRDGGAYSTIYYSKDEGVSWTPANIGLPEDTSANIEAMSITSYPGGYLLLAGYTDGQLYASEDGGASWHAIADDVGSISKGGHYNLTAVASSLPTWIRPVAYRLALRLTSFTARQAATKRRKEYAQLRSSK